MTATDQTLARHWLETSLPRWWSRPDIPWATKSLMCHAAAMTALEANREVSDDLHFLSDLALWRGMI